MDDVSKQVIGNKKCRRCKQQPCLCGNHSFELGMLMMAVGRLLHEDDFDFEDLGAAYREIARHVPGQMCQGCDYCPRLRRAVRA